MNFADPKSSERLSILTTAIALLIAFVLLTVYQFVSGHQQLQEEIRTEAAIIGTNSSAALAFNDEKAAGEILGAIRLTPRILGGALYRPDGRLLAAENDSTTIFPRTLQSEDESSAGLFSGKIRSKVLQEQALVGTLVLHFSYKSLYLRMLEYIISLLFVGAIALLLTNKFTSGLRKRMAQTEQRLERMALYDRVTGLPNRRFLEQELRKMLMLVKRGSNTAALLFIDIDDFKKVNDLCGHQAGDQVLLMISERLRGAVRAADFIARVGGDEFVVILYGIGNPENAAKVANEMISKIAEPFPTTPIPSHVGLSIGITMMPNDSDDPDILLKWSDMAMFVAKSQGKNRYQFFAEEINNRIHSGLQIEAGLRYALKHNGEGLWVAYQPQICAKTRKIVGIEALLRWTQENGVSISPGEFIPIAEKSGLIVELGIWLMQRICQDLAEMRKLGVEIPKVAVNVSPRELKRGDAIVKGICQTIEQYGEPRDRFQFELTENALMDENGSTVLDAFRSAGFSLAIDDFGSGYSSLGYLKRFQVSVLKIDRQFVQRLPDDIEDAAIVSAVIQMSNALGISVVAEGVETEEQSEFLLSHGCNTLQGFLISRPISPENLVAFVEKHKAGLMHIE